MVSSVLTHKFSMISSLKTSRFVVQFSPHQESSAEKFDKTFADCVSLRVSCVCTLLDNKNSQSARDNSLSYCKIEIQRLSSQN